MGRMVCDGVGLFNFLWAGDGLAARGHGRDFGGVESGDFLRFGLEASKSFFAGFTDS